MLINVIFLAIMSELGRSLSLPTTAAAEFPDRGYPAADFLSDSRCGPRPHNSVTEIARTAQQLKAARRGLRHSAANSCTEPQSY